MAWVVGAAGIAQLVAAGYFGLHAASLKSQADTDDALHAADRSTILSVTGLVTTGAGVYLFVTSRPPPPAAVGLAVSGGGAAIAVSGRF
jgi:hypothetical protein